MLYFPHMRWKIALAVVAALLAVGAGSLFLLREQIANYWIRQQLAGQLARALGAEVDLHGVEWKDGVLQARRFRMAGGNYPFTRLEARGLRAVVDWRRAFEPSDEPLHIEIAEADVILRDAGERTAMSGPQDGGAVDNPPPLDLLVNRITVRHPGGDGLSIEGSSLRAMQKGDAWSFSGHGGRFSFSGWPALEVERVSAEYAGGRWNIRSFAARDTKGGVLGGSAAHADGIWSGEFTWQDIDLNAFLPTAATAHLDGRSSGDAMLKDGALTGKMKLAGASSKAVGLLVKLAELIDHEDWSEVPWQIFRFDFHRHADGRVDFSDLQALSPKGIAVRGNGHYAADSLGADLQVGIRGQGRPYLGAFVPLLFSHQRDGYYWTPLKIGGSPSRPEENLTARVATALAVAPVTGAVEGATEIPGEATEAVGGLLRSLLRR